MLVIYNRKGMFQYAAYITIVIFGPSSSLSLSLTARGGINDTLINYNRNMITVKVRSCISTHHIKLASSLAEQQ
jgi:hypothetical protein